MNVLHVYFQTFIMNQYRRENVDLFSFDRLLESLQHPYQLTFLELDLNLEIAL